ncbi:riboflavin biosynthesis protein RibF [bacterium]|nr:riboflavin biosynthesis protein RibF [bacterium]
MTLVRGLPSVAPAAHTALTLGVFDGVHLGHQAILARLKEVARRMGCPAVVLTFDRHPASVVRPEACPPCIFDLEDRFALFDQLGIDMTVVVPFDERMAKVSAYSFLHDLLLGGLGAKAVVVGYDCRFGHRGEGTITFLEEYAQREHFAVYEVEPVYVGTEAVSSTVIRRAIQAGDMPRVASLLGRPWRFHARVIHGQGLGHALGFPTANLPVGEMVKPALGVYAGWAVESGVRHKAAIYIGCKPTFPECAGAVVCEVFMLEYQGDLYGKEIMVQPAKLLRADQRFDTPGALSAQMKRDVENVAAWMEVNDGE